MDTWGISLPHHMGFGLKSQVAVKVVFAVFAKSYLDLSASTLVIGSFTWSLPAMSGASVRH